MTIYIDTLSDAEIGAIFRKAYQEKVLNQMPARVQAAVEAKAEAAERDETLRQADKAARQDIEIDLGEFTIGNHTVPALDLSDVTSLDIVVSATIRSLYNKARYRGAGPRELLDKETATYAVIIGEHLRMKAEVDGKAPVVAEQVAVHLDLDAKAQVAIELIMETRGVSEKKARKILAGV